jgi:hypothetical protein
MTVSERQVVAKSVVHFYSKICNFNKVQTVKHFLAQGEKRSTIYEIIKRFDSSGSYKFRPKTGRKRSVATEKVTKKVVNLMKNSNRSERNTARKLEISKTTVHSIKERVGLKTNKCRTVPKNTKEQQNRAKTHSRKILEISANKVLILDDETYVSADPSEIKTNKHFNYFDKSEVPNEVRFKGKQKFPKQYLVWQAIDEYGQVSEPYVKKGTLKAKEYLEECLKKRLLPFIRKYHKNTPIVFWPDMASIHYQKDVIKWLRSEKIEFIEKKENVPNCPQVRPIEIFWAVVKRKYSLMTKVYKTIQTFRNIWFKLSLEVAKDSGHNIMGSVRRRLREVRSYGVFAPFTRKD